MKSWVTFLRSLPLISVLFSVVDRRMIENASSLYIAKIAQYVLPVITVPYLARVLGPETWGVVVFVQAIGIYLLLVIEYSFELSGTREVARNQGDSDKLADVVAGVLGARLVLALVCVAILALSQLLVPALRELGWLLWLGAFWYAAQAVQPLWFFVGIERVRGYLILSVTSKALAAGAIILFVNSPSDAWLVFALQGAGVAVASFVGALMVYRWVPFRRPSFGHTASALRQGWTMFLYYISSSAYSTSNTIILGFVAASPIVAFYAGAERLGRILVSMMSPVMTAMFPRAAGLAKSDRPAAARLARTSTILVFALSSIACGVLYLLAPLLVRTFLGPEYGESVTVLRILLLLLPIVGISIPLSVHWMVPNGLESLLTRITFSGGALHIPMAVVLASQYGHIGIAWALVITETYIVAAILTSLTLKGLSPFRLRLSEQEAETRAAL